LIAIRGNAEVIKIK